MTTGPIDEMTFEQLFEKLRVMEYELKTAKGEEAATAATYAQMQEHMKAERAKYEKALNVVIWYLDLMRETLTATSETDGQIEVLQQMCRHWLMSYPANDTEINDPSYIPF